MASYSGYRCIKCQQVCNVNDSFQLPNMFRQHLKCPEKVKEITQENWQDKVDRLYENMHRGCYSQLQFEYLLNAIGPKQIDTNKTATEVRMQQEFLIPYNRKKQQETEKIIAVALESLIVYNFKESTMNTKPTPTPNTNVKHQQEIINAYLEKKDVQWWTGDRWQSMNKGLDNYIFYFDTYPYRIKPEPREFIVGKHLSGETRILDSLPACKMYGWEYFKVREVLED